jgi:hypothetical protein
MVLKFSNVRHVLIIVVDKIQSQIMLHIATLWGTKFMFCMAFVPYKHSPFLFSSSLKPLTTHWTHKGSYWWGLLVLLLL